MGYGQNNQNQERQAFSLLELNNRVKGVILNAFPETCWVRAEMSDVRTNAASGHCYLEFIEKNADFIEKVKQSEVPILLVLNKIDLTTPDKLDALFDKWKEIIPRAEIFPISATENFNVDNLYKRILELLPVGEPYFDKEEMTDMPARFFVTEIIREKILLNYDKEIPYSVEVVVEEFKEETKRINIMAVINVERDSQKGIIIGHQGAALKKVGTEARVDIETFFGKKVFLNLYVKVLKDWRNKENDLKRFGYKQL